MSNAGLFTGCSFLPSSKWCFLIPRATSQSFSLLIWESPSFLFKRFIFGKFVNGPDVCVLQFSQLLFQPAGLPGPGAYTAWRYHLNNCFRKVGNELLTLCSTYWNVNWSQATFFPPFLLSSRRCYECHPSFCSLTIANTIEVILISSEFISETPSAQSIIPLE